MSNDIGRTLSLDRIVDLSHVRGLDESSRIFKSIRTTSFRDHTTSDSAKVLVRAKRKQAGLRPREAKSDRHASSRSLPPIEGISERKGSNLDASIEARS